MEGVFKFDITIPFEDGFKLDIKGSYSRGSKGSTNPDSVSFGPAEEPCIEEITEVGLVGPDGLTVALPETLSDYLLERGNEFQDWDEKIVEKLKEG